MEVTDALARFSRYRKGSVDTSWEVLIEIDFVFEAIWDSAKSNVRLVLIYYCYFDGLQSFSLGVILIIVKDTGLLLAGSKHGIFSVRSRFRVHPSLEGILRLIVVKSQLNILVVKFFQELLLFHIGGSFIVLKKLPPDLNLLELLCVIVLLLELSKHLLFLRCELSSSLDPEAIKEVEVVVEVAAWDKLADRFLPLVVGGCEEIGLVGTSLRV